MAENHLIFERKQFRPKWRSTLFTFLPSCFRNWSHSPQLPLIDSPLSPLYSPPIVESGGREATCDLQFTRGPAVEKFRAVQHVRGEAENSSFHISISDDSAQQMQDIHIHVPPSRCLARSRSEISTMLQLARERERLIETGNKFRMSHRKWRETKHQPS